MCSNIVLHFLLLPKTCSKLTGSRTRWCHDVINSPYGFFVDDKTPSSLRGMMRRRHTVQERYAVRGGHGEHCGHGGHDGHGACASGAAGCSHFEAKICTHKKSAHTKFKSKKSGISVVVRGCGRSRGHAIDPPKHRRRGNCDAPFECKAAPRPLKGGHGTARGEFFYIYHDSNIIFIYFRRTASGNLPTPNGRD